MPEKRIKLTKLQYDRLKNLVTHGPLTMQVSSTVAKQYDRLVKRGLVSCQRIQGGYAIYSFIQVL